VRLEVQEELALGDRVDGAIEDLDGPGRVAVPGGRGGCSCGHHRPPERVCDLGERRSQVADAFAVAGVEPRQPELHDDVGVIRRRGRLAQRALEQADRRVRRAAAARAR
jgi:hypothetical protein